MNGRLLQWALAAAWLGAAGCAEAANEADGSWARGSRAAPSAACGDDRGESGAAGSPRPLPVGSRLVGQACADRADLFLLDVAKDAGALFGVAVEQLGGRGELDVHVAGPSGVRFPSQAPQGTARRVINLIASGDALVLSVRLLPDRPGGASPGRGYAVSLQPLARSTSGCCSSNGGRGCADDGVLMCLCQLDNACCGGPFDATCVAEARASCGLTCAPSPPQGCCTASGTGGCAEPDVQGCVCEIDPYCCVGGFDESCVNLARHRCGAACLDGPEAAP